MLNLKTTTGSLLDVARIEAGGLRVEIGENSFCIVVPNQPKHDTDGMYAKMNIFVNELTKKKIPHEVGYTCSDQGDKFIDSIFIRK